MLPAKSPPLLHRLRLRPRQVSPDIEALCTIVGDLVREQRELVQRVDGLLCHFTSIDADHARRVELLSDHEARLRRLEKEHNFEPATKVGETSALFQAIKPQQGAPYDPRF